MNLLIPLTSLSDLIREFRFRALYFCTAEFRLLHVKHQDVKHQCTAEETDGEEREDRKEDL